MKASIFVAVVATACIASAAYAEGDVAAGKIVFRKCAICHSPSPGENIIGPTLFGVVGRRSAIVPEYSYSPAMNAADKTWGEATLNAFLIDPQALAPGTKMAFPGLPKAEDRANVIAYLSTLK